MKWFKKKIEKPNNPENASPTCPKCGSLWKYESPLHRVCLKCGRLERWHDGIPMGNFMAGRGFTDVSASSFSDWKTDARETNLRIKRQEADQQAKDDYIKAQINLTQKSKEVNE